MIVTLSPRRTRFIPGSAGNARDYALLELIKTVYPRLCGERIIFRGAKLPWPGLSPALRGTPKGRSQKDGENRFIPGSAGNAFVCLLHVCRVTVYPRLCGERFTSSSKSEALRGLSPALRGTQIHNFLFEALFRFIPGSAGNAASPTGNQQRFPVYPRLCGERRLHSE